MKTLLLAALALSLTTTLSARAEDMNHNCTFDDGSTLSLQPGSLGRKQISVVAQGTKIRFTNVSDAMEEAGMKGYLAVSPNGYGIHVYFNEPLMDDGAPSSALANILTPDGRTVSLSATSCR